jgi:hypothetical protein
MKRLMAVLAMAAAPAFAGESQFEPPRNERTFELASELVPWCKSEAEARYVAKNVTPYQWTARYHDSGNVLVVEGRLRVHGDDVAVNCRIARGARERYATIEIDDPSL